MKKNIIQISLLSFFLFLGGLNIQAQNFQSWLNQINNEIDMIEENIESCQNDIDDMQKEIDDLIKNTPSPITGTETEKRIRELQKDRALYRCWKEITEKKLKRLKEIRKTWGGGYNPSIKNDDHARNGLDPVKVRKKLDQAEQKANNLARAGQHFEDTIDSALEKK